MCLLLTCSLRDTFSFLPGQITVKRGSQHAMHPALRWLICSLSLQPGSSHFLFCAGTSSSSWNNVFLIQDHILQLQPPKHLVSVSQVAIHCWGLNSGLSLGKCSLYCIPVLVSPTPPVILQYRYLTILYLKPFSVPPLGWDPRDRLCIQVAWVQILALPLCICVTWDKSLTLSVLPVQDL